MAGEPPEIIASSDVESYREATSQNVQKIEKSPTRVMCKTPILRAPLQRRKKGKEGKHPIHVFKIRVPTKRYGIDAMGGRRMGSGKRKFINIGKLLLTDEAVKSLSINILIDRNLCKQ